MTRRTLSRHHNQHWHLCRGNQSSPWLCQPSPAWDSPLCWPTAHCQEPSGSTNPPQERGKPRCPWAMGAHLQVPSWSLPGKVSTQICNYLTQARVKRKGGGEITDCFKRHARDDLLYRRRWENLHRQFTCVTCLQGVNCSWHFTRRQHLPWIFAMKLPLFQVKLVCHYCWAT